MAWTVLPSGSLQCHRPGVPALDQKLYLFPGAASASCVCSGPLFGPVTHSDK